MAIKILLDTVARLTAEHPGGVVVTDSRGGMIAASYAARARLRAAAFNDAGRDCDDQASPALGALEASESPRSGRMAHQNEYNM